MDLEEREFVPLVRLYAIREKELSYGKNILNVPEKVVELSQQIIKNQDREYVLAIALDTRLRPVSLEVVAIGGINKAGVEPRDIFKHAILSNATGLVIVHNHPSGDPGPSKEDYIITERMKEAGELLGIPLLDHIIVGEDAYFSFIENSNEENE